MPTIFGSSKHDFYIIFTEEKIVPKWVIWPGKTYFQNIFITQKRNGQRDGTGIG